LNREQVPLPDVREAGKAVARSRITSFDALRTRQIADVTAQARNLTLLNMLLKFGAAVAEYPAAQLIHGFGVKHGSGRGC
jgi:hypothetical protein